MNTPGHAVCPGTVISLKSVHDIGAEAEVKVALCQGPILPGTRVEMSLTVTAQTYNMYKC